MNVFTFIKRLFDVLTAFILLLILWPVIGCCFFLATWDTGAFGIFTQKRTGRKGILFTIYKIRTIHVKTGEISPYGQFLRDTKIDELPQLINIILGNMTWVGPRPDVPGYYDKLTGEERKILELKPGITGLATLYYAKEEELLSGQVNPKFYNDHVIFPHKVTLNLHYYYRRSLWMDLKILFCTLFIGLYDRESVLGNMADFPIKNAA